MLLARLEHLFATLCRYQRRYCSRQRLLTLSDHQLKDIGLSRAEAEREGSKPFWRA